MVDINNGSFHLREDKDSKSFINHLATGQSWQILFAILILVFMRKCFLLPNRVHAVSVKFSSTRYFTPLESEWGNYVDANKYTSLEPVFTLVAIRGGSLTPRNSSSFFKRVSHVWRGGDRAAFSSKFLSWRDTTESSISGALWSLNRNAAMRKFSNSLCKALNWRGHCACLCFKTILQWKSSL